MLRIKSTFLDLLKKIESQAYVSVNFYSKIRPYSIFFRDRNKKDLIKIRLVKCRLSPSFLKKKVRKFIKDFIKTEKKGVGQP